MQTSIRTNHDAYLLPEPIVNEKENGGEDGQGDEGSEVLIDPFRHISFHFIHADQIGHEEVCDQEGHEPEDHDLNCTFSDLIPIPGHLAQLALFVLITIEPVFDLSEDHFHEDGLWTGPTAEDAPKDHGKEDDKNYEGEHPQHENEEILRSKNLSEQDEFPFQDIDHEEGFALDLDEWQTEKNNQVENAGNRPLVV